LHGPRNWKRKENKKDDEDAVRHRRNEAQNKRRNINLGKYEGKSENKVPYFIATK
jgi:hypothetical protein